MKEDSIEEALKKLSTGKKIKMYELLRTFKKEGIENFVITRKKYVDVILSDYKRVLKENEELLQEKINNQKIIALAQNDMLNYQAGFEDGKNRRTSAVQSIIENQQYYIFQKQFEKYEEHIKMLQKENEELKENCNIDYKRECEVLALQLHLLREEAKTTEEDYNMLKEYYKEQNEVNARFIPVQRIKDIIDRIDYDIKKTKEIISNNSNIYTSDRKNDYQIVRLRAMNTKSLDIKNRLQKLLESEE